MELDRRTVLNGLAATAACAAVAPLPALATAYRPILDGPLVDIIGRAAHWHVWPMILSSLWQFEARGPGMWAVRHVETGLTLIREPNTGHPCSVRVTRRPGEPPPVAGPFWRAPFFCGHAGRIVARHASRLGASGSDHREGAVFVRYDRDPRRPPVIEDAPPLWASGSGEPCLFELSGSHAALPRRAWSSYFTKETLARVLGQTADEALEHERRRLLVMSDLDDWRQQRAEARRDAAKRSVMVTGLHDAAADQLLY